eukprot:scaffold17242_cov126-Isochrysis_galbana.AAC.2
MVMDCSVLPAERAGRRSNSGGGFHEGRERASTTSRLSEQYQRAMTRAAPASRSGRPSPSHPTPLYPHPWHQR